MEVRGRGALRSSWLMNPLENSGAAWDPPFQDTESQRKKLIPGVNEASVQRETELGDGARKQTLKAMFVSPILLTLLRAGFLSPTKGRILAGRGRVQTKHPQRYQPFLMLSLSCFSSAGALILFFFF